LGAPAAISVAFAGRVVPDSVVFEGFGALGVQRRWLPEPKRLRPGCEIVADDWL